MAFTLLENFSFGFSLIFVQTHRRISPNLEDLTSITFGTPDPVFFPLLLLCQSFPLTWLQFPHFTKPFLCNLCSVLDTLARCLNDPDAVLQVTTTFPFLQSDYRLWNERKFNCIAEGENFTACCNIKKKEIDVGGLPFPFLFPVDVKTGCAVDQSGKKLMCLLISRYWNGNKEGSSTEEVSIFCSDAHLLTEGQSFFIYVNVTCFVLIKQGT